VKFISLSGTAIVLRPCTTDFRISSSRAESHPAQPTCDVTFSSFEECEARRAPPCWLLKVSTYCCVLSDFFAYFAYFAIEVRPGIRINSKLQCLSDHVKITLIHGMVHASGIEKHEKTLQTAIASLFAAGAYNGSL
jgi:hypothetical protein